MNEIDILIVGGLWLLASIRYANTIHRRYRRTVEQMRICYHCGYDQRGNPDATTCPECGEAHTQGKPASSLVA